MRRLIALMLLLSVLCLGFGKAGCKAEVKPVDVGGGPGIAVIVSEEDKETVDERLSNLENGIKKVVEILPIIASIAETVGELSDDEDFSEGADDVAEAAEKGAAGLGVLLAISGLIKNIVKKEDS